MAIPGITNTFVNTTVIDASAVNQNFTDLVNAFGDGTADATMGTLSLNGALTTAGAVTLGNATGDDIIVTGRIAADFDPKTASTYDLGDATQLWKGLYTNDVFCDVGAVGTPSHSFHTDTNTGMYSAGADTLNFATNGTVALSISSAQIATFAVAPVFSSGTASQTMELTAGKALTTVAITGTGSYVKSASPTFTGTVAAAALTLTGAFTSLGIDDDRSAVNFKLDSGGGIAMSGGDAIHAPNSWLHLKNAGDNTPGIKSELTHATCLTYNFVALQDGLTAAGYCFAASKGGADASSGPSGYLFYGAGSVVGPATKLWHVAVNSDTYSTGGVYGTISDANLKSNIVDTPSKLEDLLKVQIRNFTFKDDPSRKQIGVIAQELQEVFPGLVNEDDESGMLKVRSTIMLPILIKAFQEYVALTDDRIAALEAES